MDKPSAASRSGVFSSGMRIVREEIVEYCPLDVRLLVIGEIGLNLIYFFADHLEDS